MGAAYGTPLLGKDAKMLFIKGMQLGPHPGEDYVVQMSPGLFLHGRSYLIHRRAVDFSVLGKSREIVESPEAARFLDSIRAREGE